MATGKKFYWIKLRRDFMSGDIVDFLMSQRNGAQYVVLYQMLCMMCINTKGALSRQIGELIIPFDIDKIQRDCKYFSRDTITIALELFKKLGLVYEQDAGVLAITGFENLVGYETDYAIQKRNQRQMIGVSMDKIEDGEKDNSMDKEEYSPVDNVHEQVSRNIDGQIEDSNTGMDVDNVHTEIRERDKSKEIRDKKEDKELMTVSKETVCQTDVRQIVDAWNRLQNYGIKPISRICNTSKRYKSLMARIREYDVDSILAAIERIRTSDFLKGKNKNGWVITFDWFVLPNNFPKVLEGNYDSVRNIPAVRDNNNFPTRKYDYGDLETGLLDADRKKIEKENENDRRKEK